MARGLRGEVTALPSSVPTAFAALRRWLLAVPRYFKLETERGLVMEKNVSLLQSFLRSQPLFEHPC